MQRKKAKVAVVEPKFQVGDVCVYQSNVARKFGSGEGANCRIIRHIRPKSWDDPKIPEYGVENLKEHNSIIASETDLEPVVIHGLHHGLPLCLFTCFAPGYWPVGHIWALKEKHDRINCVLCKVRAGKVSDGWI